MIMRETPGTGYRAQAQADCVLVQVSVNQEMAK